MCPNGNTLCNSRDTCTACRVVKVLSEHEYDTHFSTTERAADRVHDVPAFAAAIVGAMKPSGTFTLDLDDHTAKTLALILNQRGITATVAKIPGARDSRTFRRILTIEESGRAFADGFLAGMEHVVRAM